MISYSLVKSCSPDIGVYFPISMEILTILISYSFRISRIHSNPFIKLESVPFPFLFRIFAQTKLTPGAIPRYKPEDTSPEPPNIPHTCVSCIFSFTFALPKCFHLFKYILFYNWSMCMLHTNPVFSFHRKHHVTFKALLFIFSLLQRTKIHLIG